MDGEFYVEGDVARWYNGRIKSELTEQSEGYFLNVSSRRGNC
nr:MAG TPA: hypothetical protein [Caudoviricetes sp.]